MPQKRKVEYSDSDCDANAPAPSTNELGDKKRKRAASGKPKAQPRKFTDEETAVLMSLADKYNKDWKTVTEEYNKVFGRTKDLLVAKYWYEIKHGKKGKE
ncbi:hypothetical protein HK104_000119 [Borealophlyctis nickersoniae]|nr:hypothetical protein HK104_000119 [Borealophlyctis nickersoniae]